ncbi:MAG: DUF3857 domain-containing protein [Mongoliitalea sp.]
MKNSFLRSFGGFLLISCLTFSQVVAQADLKFGKLPNDLITKKHQDSYPDDPAVILHSSSHAEIQYQQSNGFLIKYRVYRVVKILNKDGLSHADLEIPYYKFTGRTDGLNTLKGFVHYEENGKLVKQKIDKENIFDEAVSKTYAIKKVSPPSVREGAVVEIYYELTSDLFNYVREWFFQEEIPTVWSEYSFEYPEYFTYAQTTQGHLKFAKNEQTAGAGVASWMETERVNTRVTTTSQSSSHRVDYSTRKITLAVRNAPGLKSEPYIDNPFSYASRVDLQLKSVQFPNTQPQQITGSWQEVAESLLKDEDFGKHLTKGKFSKELAQQITDGLETPEEKIIAVYNHLTSTVAWDGTRGIYPRKSLDKVYKEGKGSVAEINLLQTLLLQELGLNAYAVVSTSRDKGFLNPSNPVMHKLNYVISLVQLEDQNLLVDATDASLPFGYLPTRAINNTGLIVVSGGAKWTDLKNSKVNSYASLVNVSITDQGQIQEIQRNSFGYQSSQVRRKIQSDGKEKYMDDLRTQGKTWTIKDYAMENESNKDLPFVEKLTVVAGEGASNLQQLIYLAPFEEGVLAVNPFNQEKRDFPIDFIYPAKRQLVYTLEIPEGYEIDEMPKSQLMNFQDKKIVYSYRISQIAANKLQVMVNYQLNETMFTTKEYGELKVFFQEMSKKQKEMIVLKKTSNAI